MKKHLFVAIFTLLVPVLLPFTAKAEVPAGVFGFMDNKYYGADKSLKYICFMDGNCYDLNQNLSFKKDMPLPVVSEPLPSLVISAPVVASPADIGDLSCAATNGPTGSYKVNVSCQNMYDFTQAKLEQVYGTIPKGNLVVNGQTINYVEATQAAIPTNLVCQPKVACNFSLTSDGGSSVSLSSYQYIVNGKTLQKSFNN